MANELNTPARIATEKFAEHDARLSALMANAPDLVRVAFVNLVENGGFDSDTVWTKGTSATIAAGVLSYSGSSNTASSQTVPVIFGRHYLSAFTVANRITGVVQSGFVNSETDNQSTNGTFSGGITAQQDNDLFRIDPSGIFDGDIDNVSLWEADPADDAPWLRLPFGYRVLKGSDLHPLASVQRDADMLHSVDFTEIWRNGQCFVKPSTAPGVSTRFSVVAYKGI